MTIFITNSCSDEDSLINDNSQEKLVINDVVGYPNESSRVRKGI